MKESNIFQFAIPFSVSIPKPSQLIELVFGTGDIIKATATIINDGGNEQMRFFSTDTRKAIPLNGCSGWRGCLAA